MAFAFFSRWMKVDASSAIVIVVVAVFIFIVIFRCYRMLSPTHTHTHTDAIVNPLLATLSISHTILWIVRVKISTLINRALYPINKITTKFQSDWKEIKSKFIIPIHWAILCVPIYHRRKEWKRRKVITRRFFLLLFFVFVISCGQAAVPFGIRRPSGAHVSFGARQFVQYFAGKVVTVRGPHFHVPAHIATRRSYTRHLIILTVSFGILLVTFIVQYLRFINVVVHQTETLLTSFCSASCSCKSTGDHGALLSSHPLSRSLTPPLWPSDVTL